jgi:predicted RNA-binding Zn-ribbon protein involved in translation (DUF1610 family)
VSDDVDEKFPMTPPFSRVVAALRGKGVFNRACPSCGEKKIVAFPKVAVLQVSDTVTELWSGGRTLPSAVTVCSNCGFVALHAFGALGLMVGGADNG